MTTLNHPYQYVVIRCVPRVDRGEFVNVAVVVHSQSADVLAIEAHVDEARLRCLHTNVDVDGVRAGLATLADICAGRQGAGLPVLPTAGKRFGWISAPRSTVLQPGPLHGGVCSDPVVALTELTDAMVR